MELQSKYGLVKIFTDNIESEAISQIVQMANSPLGEEAHMRIMPDVHAGKGCTIGTTMVITDKVCPNVVGVDIGCGVDLVKTNIDFGSHLETLDKIIRKNIPFGQTTHKDIQLDREYFEKNLYCWDKLDDRAQQNAMRALGSLGGGNHFIEAYENGYLSVHSGSRNLGLQIAKYYQSLAELKEKAKQVISADELKKIPPAERASFISEMKKQPIHGDLAFLTGEEMEQYLHDAKFATLFAEKSREKMLDVIVKCMNGRILETVTSTHNYIDSNNILRKGAIDASLDKKLVIPLSMRDGVLLCRGKGNEDWNNSAPHGAGRLYSRSKAKQLFTLEEYQKSMEGIFSTCINNSTIDESPFAYKNWEEIVSLIEPTVEILEHIRPIFNFKAN